MIRVRLANLEASVGPAIEMVRLAPTEAAVVEAALQILGRATNSERAAFWALDLAHLKLRVIANWSTVALSSSAPYRGLRYLTALRCRMNAAHVWRTRKPFWSGAVVLNAAAAEARPGATELGSGVWFAVKSDTFVYGVVELLGRVLERRTPDNLFVLERLGVRLGQAFEEGHHGGVGPH